MLKLSQADQNSCWTFQKIPLPVAQEDIATQAATSGNKRQKVAVSSIAAAFDHKGERIFVGNSRGTVMVIDSKQLNIITSFKVGTSSGLAIKAVEFSRNGKWFLLNCADRSIRYFNTEKLECIRLFIISVYQPNILKRFYGPS